MANEERCQAHRPITCCVMPGIQIVQSCKQFDELAQSLPEKLPMREEQLQTILSLQVTLKIPLSGTQPQERSAPFLRFV